MYYAFYEGREADSLTQAHTKVLIRVVLYLSENTKLFNSSRFRKDQINHLKDIVCDDQPD